MMQPDPMFTYKPGFCLFTQKNSLKSLPAASDTVVFKHIGVGDCIFFLFSFCFKDRQYKRKRIALAHQLHGAAHWHMGRNKQNTKQRAFLTLSKTRVQSTPWWQTFTRFPDIALHKEYKKRLNHLFIMFVSSDLLTGSTVGSFCCVPF